MVNQQPQSSSQMINNGEPWLATGVTIMNDSQMIVWTNFYPFLPIINHHKPCWSIISSHQLVQMTGGPLHHNGDRIPGSCQASKFLSPRLPRPVTARPGQGYGGCQELPLLAKVAWDWHGLTGSVGKTTHGNCSGLILRPRNSAFGWTDHWLLMHPAGWLFNNGLIIA